MWMGINNKKTLYGIIAIALGLLMIGLWLVISAGMTKKSDIVAEVNGEPIEAGEFHLVASQLRNSVFELYKSKYQLTELTFNESFWIHKYGEEDEETPNDTLRKITLDRLIQIKINQSEAKKYGFIDDADYTHFKKAFIKENERRKKAVAQGEVIYGPIAYTESVFYNYKYESMLDEVRREKAAREFKFSEDEYKQRYDEDKNTKYKLPDEMQFKKIVVQPSLQNKPIDSPAHVQAREQMQKIKQSIADGVPFEQVWLANAALQSDGGLMNVDSKNTSTYKKSNPELYKEMIKLRKDEMSGIFMANGSYYLILCTNRTDGGYMPIEEVKDLVVRDIIDPRYKQWLDDQVRVAKIVLKEKLYLDVLAKM